MTKLARGNAITLWNALSTLPVEADIVDDTDGVRIQAGGRPAPEKAMVDIYRVNTDQAAGVLTLAGNATRANAVGTLTLVENPADTETVTVGANTYTFQTVLTNVANNVLIGADASATLDNLIAAINAAAGSGTLYAAATVVHPTVVAAAGAGDTMVVTAKASGTGGNAIATTDGMANAGNVWGAATLASGATAETVVIGGRTYTFVNHLTAANQVLIGANASATIDNLIAAINGEAGAGTLYGTGTAEHDDVSAAAGAGDTMDVTADDGGVAGNSIATTETMASGSWGAVTLTGGQDQETDATTITQPLKLWGYTGSRWSLHSTLTASNLSVNGPRGQAYEVSGHPLAYQRLALTAGNATPSDSATLGATITPLG